MQGIHDSSQTVKLPMTNSASLLRCRRTIAVETGCQNIQLCSTILKVAFPPEVIGPLYLFPFIYIIFQGGEALLFIILFRCYQRFKPATEGKCLISRHYQNEAPLKRFVTEHRTPRTHRFNTWSDFFLVFLFSFVISYRETCLPGCRH